MAYVAEKVNGGTSVVPGSESSNNEVRTPYSYFQAVER
jgi:hypothetical protein